MSDDRSLSPPPAYLPPAPTDARPTLPSLPSSSGAFWGSATSILKQDTNFVEAHTAYLQARTAQTTAMRDLVDKRQALSIAIGKISALPEIAQHEYERGRRDRAHDAAMQQFVHQTAEINARINLLRAEQHLASFEPAHSAPAPSGLTPPEIDELLAALPDVSEDTRKTISYVLSGRLREKEKSR